MKHTAGAFVALFMTVSASAYAQSAWTVSFGAGAAAPTSDIASRLSTGWGIDAAVGYQLAPWLTALGEFGFARMGVPADILQQFQVPDGHGRIYSLNVDPQVQFPLPKHLQGFVEGGVGWIRRTTELTAPTVQYIEDYDPFMAISGPRRLPPMRSSARQHEMPSASTLVEASGCRFRTQVPARSSTCGITARPRRHESQR